MNFTIKKRADRNTWEARWFVAGDKNRKSFSTQDAATRWVRDQKQLAALGASPAEVTAATRLAAGTGFDLESLVRAGLDQMRGIGAHRADATMTFAEAGNEVIQRAIKIGVRTRTIKNYKSQAALLNKCFGPRVAVAITQSEFDAYLTNVPNKQRLVGRASADTKRTYLTFMKMALKVAGIVEPLSGIELPKDDSDVEFFTLAEVKTILAATPVTARGFVAVALFACVRPENLEMIPVTSISAAAKTIRISKEISKDRLTHVITDLAPPVLWEWLKLYPYEPVKWESLQRRLKRAAGRWIQDGLRHTGATFYCAVNGVNATARLLTHESESLVRSNYAGVILDTALAKAFLALKPEKIKFVEKTEVKWPDDATLEKMLTEITGLKIAAKLGCSSSALSKRCRVRGIKRPGRGSWTEAA